MRHSLAFTALCSAVVLSACSGEEPVAVVEPPSTGSEITTTTVVETPEDALREAAEGLARSIAARDLDTAWEFYSRRCQEEFGSHEMFRTMLNLHYEGRDTNPVEHTVRVSGSYGQVVTVDADPNAPADAMEPRTWTLIDGEWRFDNC